VAKPVTAGKRTATGFAAERRGVFSEISLNRFLLATVSGTRNGHRAKQRQIGEKRQPRRRRGQLGQRAADQGTSGAAEGIRGRGNACRTSGAAVDIGFSDSCGAGGGEYDRACDAEADRRQSRIAAADLVGEAAEQQKRRKVP